MTTARDKPPGLAAVLGPVLDETAAELGPFPARDPGHSSRIRSAHAGTEPVAELNLRLQDMLTGALTRAWPEVPVITQGQHHALEVLPDDCVLLAPPSGISPSGDRRADCAVTACRIRAGFPVEGIVDLPFYGVRVEVDRGMLSVTGDTDRLPAFPRDTVLTCPHHLDLARRLLPGRPVAEVPTVGIKLVLVALRRAQAAVCLPTSGCGTAPWDYAGAALAVHSMGGKAVASDGSDLAHSRPRAHAGWLAAHTLHAAADLAPLMHAASSPSSAGAASSLPPSSTQDCA
ncbi:inositol monophosphatase family protein [Streptomyces sp. SUK 48]|uniref:inositol monophosphatase family protein n=1 Tax=Streptomyces sp. SUK 48 TaxID=2582831 RepID=UPI00129AB477|nr:inositol monophosphatase family protein [Streptomyces sp. SUK 48]